MNTTSPALALTSVTLEVSDLPAARAFYAAFGVDHLVRLRASDAPSEGFRGFTLALTVARPGSVDAFVEAAVTAGAAVVKPARKSLWGYGAVVQAPDGTLWKIATSEKKHTGPASREIDAVVLLLGVADVKATRKFYAELGLGVERSFGGKYAEFAGGDASPVKLALYQRGGLAKDLGTPADGSGSHRLAIGCATGPFTDPDGFTWE
ncbi:glyoxalase [Streptomyces sp. NPDC001941]|uniref:glyoxalase n=1 Tax=Streptomyces sp. NPDC001941 TaxID=3154659 RepID=UPI0033310E57